MIPISVNFFFTRVCNYSCVFCFHTNKNATLLPLRDMKLGLTLLNQAGMRKINFTGGEPFLFADSILGPLSEFCKTELDLESVSIVSNGSRISLDWVERFGRYVDILAISCDSFNKDVNVAIGRGDGEVIGQIDTIKSWCQKTGIKFKLNTVVNAMNWQEDMNEHIGRLQPFRWKCFQLLLLEGENSGLPGDIRDGRRLAVNNAQFRSFVERHQTQPSLVVEDNRLMLNSYLLLDEEMRFLNCRDGGKHPTASILDVGVAKALAECGFDPAIFDERGGIYDWTRHDLS